MRKSLDIKIVRHGQILYHAIKSNYVTNYKCVLNKINWSNDIVLLIIPITNLYTWTKSYDDYITNAFKSTISPEQSTSTDTAK